MTKNINARDIVLKYIENLDSLEYDKAKNYLDDRIKISGPAGEQFANSTNFIKMLKRDMSCFKIPLRGGNCFTLPIKSLKIIVKFP